MKIKLNSGVEYWVSWYHQNPIKNENKMSITIFSSETPCTECIIENKTNSHIRGKGIAKLGKKEKQFNKDFGRKISLKKAMTTIGLNKETRTLFWNEYHKLTNKPQRIK
jgi:hypothetical protein